MKYRESEEMYLETIFLLKNKKPSVRSIDIVTELGYSRPSVSRAVGLLQKKGYIEIRPNGEIIFTESVEIERQDNIGTLHDKLMEVGSRLVCKTVDALQSGNVQTQPQTQSVESVPEYARYAPKLTPATGKIDWNSSAEQIYNLVRGLSPRPGTHSTLCFDEQQLEMKIFQNTNI